MKKNLLRKLFVSLAAALTLLASDNAQASHAMGADLTYECLGGNTYRLRFSFYRDCIGISAPNGVYISISSASCGQSLGITCYPIPGTGLEVTPICPSAQSTCNGGNFTGIQEWIYEGIVTLPMQCTDWIFGYDLCCRNAAITTISTPGASTFHIFATLNNTIPGCNSSPVFANKPVPFICLGQQFCFNHGAFDPDGDSLVYSLITPMQTSGTTVNYIPPYSATDPLNSVPAMQFNSQTGDFCITPQQLQVTVMAVLVQEYRNGVLIGTVERDIQITVINCSNNLPSLTGINGTTNFSMTACANEPFCFDIFSSDPDPGQNVFVSWDGGIVGGTFTTNGAQPPVGTFCWTPGDQHIGGTYCFTATVHDDACPYIGTQVYSYCINVVGIKADAGPDVAIACNDVATLYASATGGSGTYTYQWSTGATTVGITVGAGTYILTASDGQCSDTDTVEVINSYVPTAAFSAIYGCVNVPVQFTDLSTTPGGIIIAWNWNFGDGSLSNVQHPVHLYNAPGTYNVQLVIENNLGCLDTIVQPVIITPVPVAAFTAPSGCAGTGVTLNNTSVPPGGIYTWNLGNGQTSNGTNPTVVYGDSGTYTITLIAGDSSGCADTVTQQITIYPLPVAGFSFSGSGNCQNSTISFTNTSTGGITYSWNFGNGQTSTQQNPTTTYNQPGNYNVTVVVTSANGCVDSITQTIVVYPPPVANAGANVSVCQGSNVTLTATGGGTYTWSTGATTGSISVSPSGTTTYTVTITDAFGCTATDQVTVTVNPLPVPVVSPDQSICIGQSATLTASGGITYNWNPTGANTPSITVSPSTSTTYAVNVSNANGCTATAFVNVVVNPLPVVNLNNAFVCTGQTTVLNAGNQGGTYVWSPGGQTSQTITVTTAGTYGVVVTNQFGCTASGSSQISLGGSITNSLSNAEFCNGDSAVLNAGNPGNAFLWSTGQTSQSITVSQAGSYSVTITDPNGCSGTVATTVNVFPLPVAQFTPNDACINQPISFVDVSTVNGGTIVSWQWNFGDGNFSQQQNPTHQYISNGTQTITLIVTTDQGCTDTITKSVNIYPLPQANFTHAKLCESETTQFTDLSFTNFGNILSWNWDFGDGFTSTLQHPTHQYPGPGIYTVTLTVVTNGGCVDVRTHTVTIYPNPNLSISMPAGCAGTAIPVTNNSSTTNGAINNWLWNFGNGTTSAHFTPPAQVYNNAGTYTVSLIASTSHGCTDSISIPLTIFPNPVANAGPDQSVCLGQPTTLTASGGGTYAWTPGGVTTPSITVTPQVTTTYTVLVTNANGCQDSDSVRVIIKSLPIANAGADQAICNSGSVTLNATGGVAYNWSPGGATTASILVSPAVSTVYTVTVIGGNGCTATDSVAVTVNPSPPASAGPDVTVCAGTTVSLAATGGVSYAWSNGSTASTIYVNPQANATYIVTVTDSNGCSAKDTVAVTVNAIPAVLLSNELICAGENVVLDAGNPGATYQWSPGGQTTQTITVTQAGTYSVVVTSANGCQAGASATITVGGTGIISNLGNAIFCAGQSTVLNAGNPGATYLWSTGVTTQTITVTAAGTYSVTITDPLGCSDTYQSVVSISPLPVPSFIATPACINTPVTFTDGSTLAQGSIIQWAWDFGDGTIASSQNPTHVFPSSGTYSVSLLVTSGNGCTASVVQPVTISPGPLADFGSNAACFGDQTLFTDLSSVTSGNITGWNWQFGDGGTSSLQHPAHTYNGDGTYTVTLVVTTSSGCADTVNLSVTVNPTPIADFSAAEECFGLPTQFTDLSTINNGSIDGWAWDFGDGSTSSMQNPTHTYTAAGTYNVTLIVNSDLGCLDTVYRTVQVNPISATGFTAGNVCQGNATIFTDISQLAAGSITGWYWEFGDGYSSSVQHPVHAYNNYGTYTVLLAITTNLGCIDTLLQPVTVYPKPNASFGALSQCEGQATLFTDSSSVPLGTLAGWLWNFGNGNTATVANPSHTFVAPGTYNVSLVVTTGNGCTDTVMNSVNVFPEPNVLFSSGDVCNGAATAFTNQTTVSGGGGAGVSAVWNFGDGTSDTTLNPQHVYAQAGTYQVTMTATTPQGCSGNVTLPVTVFENPVAKFRGLDVCIDEFTMFLDSSYVPNNGGSIISWAWNFGDGGTSVSKNPIHQYANPGTYNVSLAVMSDKGCIDSYNDSVRVYVSPQPVIAATGGCITDPVVFVNTSDPTNAMNNNILWHFGDGTSSAAASPTHIYAAPGTYTVTLEVINATNCRATVFTDVDIYPQPSAGFTADDGCAGEQIQFVNTSIITAGTITGFQWNFGDNTTSVLENPVHTYNTPGVYTVQLIVISSLGCADTVTAQVTVFELPVSQFTAINTEGCGPLPVQFTDNSFIGNGTIVGWNWNFGDGGTDTTQNPVHVYTATGNYTVTLTVTSNKGCQQTVTINNAVTVYPDPVAEFMPEPEITTTLNPVFTFTNLSEGAVSHQWNFGDGQESSEWNPTHAYTDSGTFVVTLTVVNAWGCVDTVQHIVKVIPVTTFFIPNCFTPNSDGNNDVFLIKGYNIVNIRYDIWNRWGEKVYTTADALRSPWDGVIGFGNGYAKEDVYIYVATILDVNGQIHSRTGRVSLVR